MRIPACDGFQETLLYCLDTLDVGSYLLETGLPKAATRLPGDLTSVLGQNEKYSERVDIFRSCTNNRHPRFRRKGKFSFLIQYSANALFEQPPAPATRRLRMNGCFAPEGAG